MPGWKDTFEMTRIKPQGDKFLLQRVVESMFQIVYYIKPFYLDSYAELNFAHLREAIYSLVKKTLDKNTTRGYLKHNMMCTFETIHACIHHQYERINLAL